MIAVQTYSEEFFRKGFPIEITNRQQADRSRKSDRNITSLPCFPLIISSMPPSLLESTLSSLRYFASEQYRTKNRTLSNHWRFHGVPRGFQNNLVLLHQYNSQTGLRNRILKLGGDEDDTSWYKMQNHKQPVVTVSVELKWNLEEKLPSSLFSQVYWFL